MSGCLISRSDLNNAMLLLNFAHPLTAIHLIHIAQLLKASGPEAFRVIGIPTRLDTTQPFAPQITTLLSQVQLTPTQWQTEPLLINLPSLNHAAALLLAELHGRMGYFPTVIRLSPIPNHTPPQFEVAEIINLQSLRDEARTQR
jgi:hypothetical protein